MTKYISDKLTVLYTMLIIMVVYIHSYYPQGEAYPVAIIIFYYPKPLLLTITAVLVARLLKRFTPRLYAVLTGGR
jgi:hypothetical protein